MIDRKDPYGYYIIPLNKECLGKDLNKILTYRNIVVEEYGNTAIIRTKSRSVVNKITRNRNLSKCIEYS